MNRRWTIRARITTLLLAPMIPLLAMLVFATTVALTPALNLRNARISIDAAGLPAASVVTDLQIEREVSVINVSLRVPNQNETSGLTAARGKTDIDATALTRLSSDSAFRHAANAKTLAYLAQLTTELQKLTDERASIDQGISRIAVMTFYNGLIQTTFNLYGSIASLDDPALQQEADGVVGMAQASEFLTREDAIVAGMLASGAETNVDYMQFVATVNTKQVLYDHATRYLDGPATAAYQKVLASDPYANLTKLENELITKPTIGKQPTINPTTWHNDFNAVATSLGIFEAALAEKVIGATGDAATSQETRLIIAVGASVLMLLILLFFSLRVARSLIRRVAGLRMDALSLALDRLPSVVGRLRRGEVVDLPSETPPLKYGSDELGQLGDAFTRVQETAITSAVQEANLRHGFNQVFLNIARRSQTLLHRQLALLDKMERRTEDPDQLEELFRVDHLATRMRRHAEDLVILAGSTPGRGWRNPVPFADVLRAAASEVEEYARINVVGVPEVGVVGRAVSDVVHLLAELLENATMFSPPETQVLMSGQSVPNGFVIEIEDRGLGMSLAALDDANARLASPPDFDPANSSRLGLFVVARLAARHGIAVALRRSPYGGVAAVALIPSELVVAPSEIGSGSHGAPIGARLPSPRRSAEEDTAERPIAGAAPTAIAVLDDALSDATLMLTLDGLPKRSRQASVARKPSETTGSLGFNTGAPGHGNGPSAFGPSDFGPSDFGASGFSAAEFASDFSASEFASSGPGSSGFTPPGSGSSGSGSSGSGSSGSGSSGSGSSGFGANAGPTTGPIGGANTGPSVSPGPSPRRFELDTDARKPFGIGRHGAHPDPAPPAPTPSLTPPPPSPPSLTPPSPTPPSPTPLAPTEPAPRQSIFDPPISVPPIPIPPLPTRPKPAPPAPYSDLDAATVALPTPAAPRTPEQMRMMLSSFQDGMALGRRDAAGLPRHAETGDAGTASTEVTEPRTRGLGSNGMGSSGMGSSGLGTNNGGTSNMTTSDIRTDEIGPSGLGSNDSDSSGLESSGAGTHEERHPE